MATGMQNVKQPNTAPMIFRCNAPWEMRKANDSGCLCKDCESFHLLRRGVLGACVAIDKVLERLEGSVVGSTDVGHMYAYLTVIKDVIGTPSKYDTIVKCLKPCLGITKRYQIVVKTEGCIYWRKRSCWCLTCMGSLFQGSLEWGNNHDSDGCDLVTETLVGSESMYCFEKKICQKTAGPGVAVQSQSLTRDRNEMAARLTVGDFVLFKQNDDEIEPIWLGRIMSNPEWQGQGVYHNKSRRNITFDGTPVGRGEVVICDVV